MDEENHTGILIFDAIEKVAMANLVKVEGSHILPEIRASPCRLHTKHSNKTSKLLLDSSHHSNNSKWPTETQTKEGQIKEYTEKGMYRDDPIHGSSNNFQSIQMSSLPSNMPTKEFVTSWIMHGSEPSGAIHFPGIVKENLEPSGSNSRRGRLCKISTKTKF